jgi:hypothetical protein
VNCRSLYCFAHLGGVECGVVRLRGVGLANSLFPWARCIVSSKKFDLVRIASTWPQLCHRQWLRRDRDRRWYAGLFDEGHQAVSGLRKLLLLSTTPRIVERDFLSDPARFQKGVVVFSGIHGYFANLLDEHAYVKEALLASARTEHTAYLGQPTARRIHVHVRLGDFTETNGPFSEAPRLNVRQPIGWFVDVVRQLRQKTSPSVPVSVFSDGNDEELLPLLAMPNTERVTYGSSLADLLALASARTLIASGSTFSMWAAYLGRMPVIWPPGQRRQKLHGANWEYEPEVGMGPLPESVTALVRGRLCG